MVRGYISLFIVLFGFGWHCSIAQKLDCYHELRLIDSLIEYTQHNIAQQHITNLSNYLDEQGISKENQKIRLNLKYLEALNYDRQEANPEIVLVLLTKLSKEAKDIQLIDLSYKINLLTALSFEKVKNLAQCKKYLDEAHRLYQQQHLDSLYSTYCIRMGSYYLFVPNYDSANYYGLLANKMARRYKNEKDLSDSHIILGSVAEEQKRIDDAILHQKQVLAYTLKINHRSFAVTLYNNLALHYLDQNLYKEALQYNDSSMILRYALGLQEPKFTKTRYKIFFQIGNKDSTNYYFNKYVHEEQTLLKENETAREKRLEAIHTIEKSKLLLDAKNKQIISIIFILGIILFGSLLLLHKNFQIDKKNKIIDRQLKELAVLLSQKQVLLAEFQHRVKNNLQHVISILELQKESAQFNNIEELLRSNQNRVHSIALLHKKLDISENVDEVNMEKYFTELAEMVKESYDRPGKTVKLFIECQVGVLPIDLALPLGLILTELVSNSMKYAFVNREIGIIDFKFNSAISFYEFWYNDNGEGFDFNQVSQNGLGMELIKGLIEQIEGSITTPLTSGFSIKISFPKN